MASPENELRLYRFLDGLWARLRDSRDVDQALRAALRLTVDHFGASGGCLAQLGCGGRRAELAFELPAKGGWDLGVLADFLRHERPPIAPDTMLAPIRRRERDWRVIAIRGGDCSQDRRAALAGIAKTLSVLVGQIDRDRIAEVRARIDRKITEELRPKDLFYQILHGLRVLTGYDHSSALLIAGESGDALELVAEQIAWRKGKSRRIGSRLVVTPELAGLLQSGEVYGFERHDDGWRDWTGNDAEPLADLLQADGHEGAMLCAPLSTRDGLVAVLRVASQYRGHLGPFEAALVKRFMPQVAVAIQNSRRTETLQAKVLEAERKHAMANLARSVSHDVNNALGAVLPLVQQIRSDLAEDRLDLDVLARDLEEIESSLQLSRRIFSGMLAFARGAARGTGRGNVRDALEAALGILQDGMKRRGIAKRIELPDSFPPIHCRSVELEQLLFNLLANARDAMPDGGTLRVTGAVRGDRVELQIEDTGCGIPERHLPHVREPFFTTKKQGNGLGLTICRSIVWEMRGKMEIDSREGEGTRVSLSLPVADDAPPAEDA